MSRLTLKLTKPIHHVEIISSKDIHDGRIYPYIPKEFNLKKKIKGLDNIDSTFLEDDSDLNSDELSDSFEYKNIPAKEVRILIQESYDKGFDDGRNIAEGTFKNEVLTIQDWVKQFDKISIELRKIWSNEIKQLEESLITLSIAIAEHILQHEVSGNSEIVIQQTKKALAELDKETIYKIHLHPDDVNILENVKSELLEDPTRIQGVAIVPDSNVQKGSCLLVSSVGKLDARFQSQLETMQNSIEKAISSLDYMSDTFNPITDNDSIEGKSNDNI